MVGKSKPNGFGNKGMDDRPRSFAEQLLSGKPIERGVQHRRGPKLKPRPKPVFGRGEVDRQAAVTSPWPVRSKPASLKRRYWTRAAIAFVIGVPVLLLVLEWARAGAPLQS